MAKYKSVGTIRYEDKGQGTGVKWFFVPDTKYCVEHYGKKHANFLNRDGNPISRKLPKSGEGVKLKDKIFKGRVKRFSGSKLAVLSAAKSAAMSQSKVMVTVKNNGNGLSLIGVSPPPK